MLAGTEEVGADDVECITGIEYFADVENHSSDPLQGSGFGEPEGIPGQYGSSASQMSQYQTFYNAGGIPSATLPGLSDGNSQADIGSLTGYEQLPQHHPEVSSVDILGLPSEEANSLDSVRIGSVRQSPGLSSVANDSVQTHGCQLCKRRFCNPVNLLRHMKEFHHVDAAHVVGRRRISALRKVGAERWQVAGKSATDPNTRYIPIAPKTSGTIVNANLAATSVGASNAIFIPIDPTPALSRLPVSVVPYGRGNENSRCGSYGLAKPNNSEAVGSSGGESSLCMSLTPAQIKEAEALIVADMESFYCSKCCIRFSSRTLGVNHARTFHFGETTFLCRACNTEYTSEIQHSQVCRAFQVYASGPDIDSSASAGYTLTPINVAKTNRSVLTIRPAALPPSSSEISSTSADVLIPSTNSIFPSSSSSPDCEVSSQAKDNSPECIVIDDSDSKKAKAIDYQQFIASNGILTEEQVQFAFKMARKVTDGESVKYECKICKFKFTQPGRCREHVRHIHLKQYYKCGQCDGIFQTRKMVDTHRAEQHRNKESTIAGNKKETVIVEPVGIHPKLIPAYLDNYVVRVSANAKDTTWKCRKCDKILAARKYALSHVRQVHFNKIHQCPSCGLYFEEGLHIHRRKCTASSISVNADQPRDSAQSTSASRAGKADSFHTLTETATEVSHLADMMRNSLQEMAVVNINGSIVTVYKCVLCSSSFDKRINAESHLWIEHIRSEWAKKCGNSNVDDIYLKFLQAQFISQNAGDGSANLNIQEQNSIEGSSVDQESQLHYTGEVVNTLNDENDTQESFFNENEDEMLFDPSSVSGTSMYVEESTATGRHVTQVSLDDSDVIANALQCKVEIHVGEENLVHENEDGDHSTDVFTNDDDGFPEAGSPIAATRNTIDDTAILAESVAVINGSSSSALTINSQGSKPTLSEAEVKRLDLKSLRFIKESQGQFVCIVCQRVSKLRRNLVEHVRRVHLCGEKEEDVHPPEASTMLPTSGGTGKAYYEEIVSRAVQKFLSDKSEPPVTLPSFGKRNVQDRASRFVRPDGFEFFCTICKVRSTKSERLIQHISTVHFGEATSPIPPTRNVGTEEVLRCPGCKKIMPSKSFKARHVPRCSLAKRLIRHPRGRPVGSFKKPPETTSRYTGKVVNSNFYVDFEGNVRRKVGRPFRNPSAVTGPRGEKYVIDPTGKPVPELTAVDDSCSRALEPTETPDTDTASEPEFCQKQSNNSSHANLAITQPVSRAAGNNKPRAGGLPSKHPHPIPSNKSSKTIATPETTENLRSIDKSKVDKPETAKTISNINSTPSMVLRPEDVKKLIIPWSIGGKYSFSKCKECSVLFTKYANAEAHVRNAHSASVQTTLAKESSLPDNDKTLSPPLASLPPKTPPPHLNKNSDDEENSPELTPSSIGKTRSKRSYIIDSDSEEDERGVYEGFSPAAPSSDEEETQTVETDATNPAAVSSDQVEKIDSSKPKTSTTQSQVLSKFRPFSAFQSGDALKKYLQPKRVSKALTSLTSKEFTDAQNFIVKIERNGYECRECGGKFPRLNAISRHVRLKHFVERPYHCTSCDARFFHLNEYESHKSDCAESKGPENMSSERPKLLAQSWSDNSKTKSKVEKGDDSRIGVAETRGNIKDAGSFIEKIGKKRSRCKICKLTFASGYSGVKHVRRIHFDEKPFKCSKCNETFRYLETSRNHEQVCGTGNPATSNEQVGEEPVSSIDLLLSKDFPSSEKSENKSILQPEQPTEKEDPTFRCKLCNEVSSDKPLFRYHLVSVHYEELSKGKASSFFDMIEDIIDTLAIKVEPRKTTIVLPAKANKKRTATGKSSRSKKRSKGIGTVVEDQSSVQVETESPSPQNTTSSSEEMMEKSICTNPVAVHSDEKQLLQSLPTVEYKMEGTTQIQTVTVRLTPLSFNGILPNCLLIAAKNLCGKLDAGTFQCKNCGRCFGTYQGVYGHVRIRHFGERRYQCDICHVFIADGLSKHRERCLRKTQGGN